MHMPRHDRTDNRSMCAVSTLRSTSRPSSSQCAHRLRLALVARSARLISNGRRLARRGQPRLGVLLGQRHERCSRLRRLALAPPALLLPLLLCCTISPKPLEETRSACCSRHELSADASRAAASRASACCSGSGMNEAHGYAASRSRHRHFCCRCCTISPKPLEETRSACCSRHELSADTPVPA